jgi:hypothetical protein
MWTAAGRLEGSDPTGKRADPTGRDHFVSDESVPRSGVYENSIMVP